MLLSSSQLPNSQTPKIPNKISKRRNQILPSNQSSQNAVTMLPNDEPTLANMPRKCMLMIMMR